MVEIREATASDHSNCAEILSRAWNHSMPDRTRMVGVEDFRDATRGEFIFIAVRDGSLVGFVSVWKPSCFVHHLFVDPVFQGRGVGSALLRHVAMLAGDRPLSLKCQLENHSALRFYESRGFQPTASRGCDEFGDWVELRDE